MSKSRRAICCAIGLALLVCVGSSSRAQDANPDEDLEIALDLATMLQSARWVIGEEQDLINDPARGDKGLTGDVVLAKTLEVFRQAKGAQPKDIDPQSRHGRLLRAGMDAIRTVIDENQSTINEAGLGFKGFVPAVFGRLVTEEFRRTIGNEAEIKITAPPALVRNRKASPDEWETAAIRDKLSTPEWPKGQVLAAKAPNRGREAFRVLVPEYYSESCMTCHGKPKGQLDITGYPMEGASVGDLGGVYSVTFYRR